MGQLERVEEERRARKVHTQNGNGRSGRGQYLSFNPTREEKEAIRGMPETLEDVLDFMSTWLQDGYTLTWKYMTKEECYSVTLRENSGDWQKDRALSCWHVDWLKCWRMIFYALHNRYSDWPELRNYTDKNDLEW